MPLIPYTPQPVRFPVAARLVAGREIPQDATLASFHVDMAPDTHELSAELIFTTRFVNDDGTPAEQGRGISTYRVPLRANNNAAVDVTTGDVRYLRRLGEPTEIWDELLPDGSLVEVVGGLAATPEQLMLQGNALREELNDLVALAEHHLNTANGPMYDKFR